MKPIKLAWNFLRVGIANELQYRANFFIQILQTIIALCVGLIGIGLVFGYTTDLNGWGQPELLAVLGIFMIMSGLTQAAIQPNMGRLMEDIQAGTLDFALTKPVDGQTIVSVREFRFWKLTDVVTGFVVLAIAVFQLQLEFSLPRTLAFVAALIMGSVMIYCFWLMLTSTAFWLIRVDHMVNLFEGIFAAGRWPVTIYPNWLRYSLTFLVPVAFAITVPAQAITGSLTPATLLFALGLMVAFLVLARLIWRRGVKNYSGASA
jgi:ABC-2 type transport system permease protein